MFLGSERESMKDKIENEYCGMCTYYKFFESYGSYCCFNSMLLRLIPEDCCIRDFCPLVPEEKDEIW